MTTVRFMLRPAPRAWMVVNWTPLSSVGSFVGKWERRRRFRISIQVDMHHLEKPRQTEDRNDFFGTTVQLAARLCAAAESDQILISDKIFQEYGSADVLVHGDRYRLKCFAEPVLAYRCEWPH